MIRPTKWIVCKEIVFAGLGVLLALTAYSADPPREPSKKYKKLFERSEKSALELRMALDKTGKTISFYATNTSKADMKVTHVGVSTNFLLALSPSGHVTRHAIHRRVKGGYNKITVPAGTTKVQESGVRPWNL